MCARVCLVCIWAWVVALGGSLRVCQGHLYAGGDDVTASEPEN